jgi:hypothetical protein
MFCIVMLIMYHNNLKSKTFIFFTLVFLPFFFCLSLNIFFAFIINEVHPLFTALYVSSLFQSDQSFSNPAIFHAVLYLQQLFYNIERSHLMMKHCDIVPQLYSSLNDSKSSFQRV